MAHRYKLLRQAGDGAQNPHLPIAYENRAWIICPEIKARGPAMPAKNLLPSLKKRAK